MKGDRLPRKGTQKHQDLLLEALGMLLIMGFFRFGGYNLTKINFPKDIKKKLVGRA